MLQTSLSNSQRVKLCLANLQWFQGSSTCTAVSMIPLELAGFGLWETTETTTATAAAVENVSRETTTEATTNATVTEPSTENVNTAQPDPPESGKKCVEEPNEGTCRDDEHDVHSFRYFFNVTTRECEAFSSGCHGNGNNFASLEDCRSECNGTLFAPVISLSLLTFNHPFLLSQYFYSFLTFFYVHLGLCIVLVFLFSIILYFSFSFVLDVPVLTMRELTGPCHEKDEGR